MLYAVDLDAARAAFAGRTDATVDEVVAYLDAHAHLLANAAHMPAPLDDLLALDDVLAATGYPGGFRYAALFADPSSLGVVLADDAPLVGAIAADVVTAAAAHARDVGAPAASGAWEARALDELVAAAFAAAELRCGLVGVYT